MSTGTAQPSAEPGFSLIVAHREAVADGVVALELRREHGGPLPAWTAGAHIDVVLGEHVRQYSLLGDPVERDRWRIAVLREPAGRGGSAAVHDTLGEGSVVTVRGPRNHFALEPARAYLFIAGGIGITPILAMVREAERAGAGWRLAYGGRGRRSMAFAEALAGQYGERVDLVPEDERGLIDLESLLGRPQAGTLVYCCGPEPLLRAVEQGCAPWPAGSLHVERFAPKPIVEDAASDTAFALELSVSQLTLEVPAGRSILEVVTEAGIPTYSSCGEGTCGTCETAVLSGVPDHRDSVLTAEERAAGDTMMICVSRSCTPRLVLEL